MPSGANVAQSTGGGILRNYSIIAMASVKRMMPLDSSLVDKSCESTPQEVTNKQ